MLRDQKRDIPLNRGPDTWLLRSWDLDLFRLITMNEPRNAYDEGGLDESDHVGRTVLQGSAAAEKRCYVMIGYDGETLREAARLYSVLSS